MIKTMCGRYANHVTQIGDWADILGDWPTDISSSYNVAPTQTVPVFYKNRVMAKTQGIGMRWGLVPAWSKEINPKFATFNARSESMAEKPSFRTAWKKSQTCLIPALGYYEWKGPKGEKQPYFISMTNQEPLVMAGLWDYYQDGNQGLFSCTIITQPAEGSLTEIHSRMPVMVARYHAEAWLDNGANRFNLIAKQQHTDRLDFYPVDKAVNRAASDNENLILKQKSL